MSIRNTVIRIVAMLMCCGVLYAEETDVHLVQAGETFSQIAKKYLGEPVYKHKGVPGSFAKLSELNPEIKDHGRIFPGDKIRLKPKRARRIASAPSPPALPPPSSSQTIPEPPKSASNVEPKMVPVPNEFEATSPPPVAENTTEPVIAAATPEATPTPPVAQAPPVELPPVPAPAPAPPKQDAPELLAVEPKRNTKPVASAPISSGPPSPDASEDGFPVSHLGLDAGFEFFTITATQKSNGAATTLVSNLSPQTRLTWDLEWSKDWTSRLRFNYEKESIEDNTSSNQRSIQDSSSSRYGFEAGAIRNWSDSSRTGFSLVISDQVFEHAPNPDTVVVDHVTSPSLKVSQELDFVHLRTASMGMGVSGKVIAPGSGPGYTTDTGYGGDASVYLKHETKNFRLSGSVYYGMEKQNTSVVQQQENHLGGLLGITWKFGD